MKRVSIIICCAFLVSCVQTGELSSNSTSQTTTSYSSQPSTSTSSGGSSVVQVQSVSLSKANGCVYSGISLTLSATIYPSNATNKSITWTSSNKNVATVSSNGVVTYVGSGTTYIRATANNGVYGECTIKGGKLVTITSPTSGTLTRDDGVSGTYSNLRWTPSGSPVNGNQWGTISWSFIMNSSTASRGGVYYYIYDSNHNRIKERWYQFGMISPNTTLTCSDDVGIPLESFYTVEFGTNGMWYSY